MLRVVETIIAAMTLGSRWRRMMIPFGTPIDRAASTKSRSLSDLNSPRMTRANHIQEKTPRKTTTLSTELPYIANRIRSRKIAGKASMRSTERMSRVSIQTPVETRDGPDHDPDQRRDQRGANRNR